MLTPLNTIFVRETEREILGKMERGKVKEGETDKKTVRKTLCS